MVDEGEGSLPVSVLCLSCHCPDKASIDLLEKMVLISMNNTTYGCRRQKKFMPRLCKTRVTVELGLFFFGCSFEFCQCFYCCAYITYKRHIDK